MRHFDLWSLLWLVGDAPHIGLDLFTDSSCWPSGHSILRSDSLLVLFLGGVLTPLVGADAVIIGLVLLGPVLSGWAAEHLAVATFGARWPWSIIAGLAYAFCGLAGTALLEGHVYFLLSPWLPLLASTGMAATQPDARLRDGALAGLMWALCLLSTAYLGVVATLLVLAMLGRAAWRGGWRWGPPLGAMLVAVPVGLVYVGVFVAGAPEGGAAPLQEQPVHGLRAGSATLASLAGWTPSMDAAHHSIAPWLPHVALVLALTSPLILPRRRAATGWLLLAGLLVAASLGPYVDVPGVAGRVPWLLVPLTWLERDVLFHFPARLLWLAVLILGVVGAAVATRLAERARSRGQRLAVAALLAFAWLDAVVMPAIPSRGAPVPLAVPTAYQATPTDLGILELAPVFLDPSWDLELYTNNLVCSYQRVHGRPLANACIGTRTAAAPRRKVTDWLFAALLTPAADLSVVEPQLASMGFGAVAFHPDWFPEPDRGVLREGLLATLGAPLAVSRDAGELVEIYPVHGAQAADRDGHRQALQALLAEGAP